ncbi:MAG: hypothetical protein OdinLCB4_003915 [Candidatus Odinarchaeum yellowstonii]|uniref:Replication factor A protein 3 n=1 Tax=Odinarchaeota yellowstonii (strain LCB_4) TaxID=1841599 RepID=A0AAF0IAB1_ODILC|nr:MAG: hypothetical protein OdinLCB4_003915 [Candidatus Odinarchaeum yellowstonii]
MSSMSSAVWRIIKDIKPTDSRVRILGRIIEANKNYIVIDDGTGLILVDTTGVERKTLLEYVLVIGEVHQKTGNKLIIEAELITSFKYVNMEIYHKTYNLVKAQR